MARVVENHNMVPVLGVVTGRAHAARDMPNFGCENHVWRTPCWVSRGIIFAFHTHIVAGLKHYFIVSVRDYLTVKYKLTNILPYAYSTAEQFFLIVNGTVLVVVINAFVKFEGPT